MVSPIKGQPILPGGRLSLGCFLFLLPKKMKMRRRGKRRDMIEQRGVRGESDMEVALSDVVGVFYVIYVLISLCSKQKIKTGESAVFNEEGKRERE